MKAINDRKESIGDEKTEREILQEETFPQSTKQNKLGFIYCMYITSNLTKRSVRIQKFSNNTKVG